MPVGYYDARNVRMTIDGVEVGGVPVEIVRTHDDGETVTLIKPRAVGRSTISLATMLAACAAEGNHMSACLCPKCQAGGRPMREREEAIAGEKMRAAREGAAIEAGKGARAARREAAAEARRDARRQARAERRRARERR